MTRMRRGPPPADVDAATKDDNALVGAFQGSITVEPVRRSRLVRLHFDSTDPFFAAKAVNALAQSFININLERRFEEVLWKLEPRVLFTNDEHQVRVLIGHRCSREGLCVSQDQP